MNILSSIQKAASSAAAASSYTLYTGASSGSNQYITYNSNTQTVSGITASSYKYGNGAYTFSTLKSLTNAYLMANTTNTTALGIGYYGGTGSGALQGYFVEANIDPVDVDGVSLLGAWYKQTLPYRMFVSSYYIGSATGANVIPLEWTVGGSNDGINWTTIHQVAVSAANKLTATNKTYSLTTPMTIPYSQFRISIIKTSNAGSGGGFCNLTRFYVNGTAVVGNYPTVRVVSTDFTYVQGYTTIEISPTATIATTDTVKVYWRETTYGAAANSMTATGATTRITGLTAGTTYKIWITIKDTLTGITFGGEYTLSKTITAYTISSCVSVIPYIVSATISIENIPLESTYRYNYYWCDVNDTSVVYSSLNNTNSSIIIGGLAETTSYYYWITITNTLTSATYGSADWINTYPTFTTVGTVINAILNSNNNSITIDLYNLPSDGIPNYTYNFYWTWNGGSGSNEGYASKIYTVTGLTSDVEYTLWATATDTTTGITYGGSYNAAVATLTNSIPIGGGGLGLP